MTRLAQEIAALSPEKRKLLELTLRERGIEIAGVVTPRVDRRPSYPVSHSQRRLWFLDRLAPANSAYHISTPLCLEGALDLPALARSLDEIVRRHEALRTSFDVVDGEPVQVVHDRCPRPLPVIDLAALEAGRGEREADRLAGDDARRGFDLARGPLLRTALLAHGAERHTFLATLHHIVSDGWSIGIFFRELLALYEGLSKGEPTPLEPLPVQYVDFTLWQRRWLRGGVYEAQMAYWRRQLAGLPPALELPFDRPRPSFQTFRGGTVPAAFSRALSAALRDFCRRERSTLFTALLTAFKVWLHRSTGRHDVVVGSPVANRHREEIEGLIGCFVNTLVLRTDLSGRPSFRALLGQVRQVTADATAHQDLPFEKLVDELQPERSQQHNPLFQVSFSFQNQPGGDSRSRLRSLVVHPRKAGNPASMFDLSMMVTETPARLAGDLNYNSDLFDRTTVRRMGRQLAVLLRAAVAEADISICDLPLLDRPQRHQLLVEGNSSPAAAGEVQQTLPGLFEAQVVRTPDRVALTFEGEALTYRELNLRADRLGRRLRRHRVGKEVLVGLCLERSPAMVVAILGVLKAGGAYVPLDPAYPRARLELLLEDCATPDGAAPLLVAQESTLGALPGRATPVVRPLGGIEGGRLCMDRDRREISGESAEEVFEDDLPGPDHLAYVIYTSGSTGRPRGVQVTHGNVVRLFAATAATMDFSAGHVWTLFHSFAFDFSVWEIWGALLHGGRLVVVPYWLSRSPDAFHDLLADEQVTVLSQTPAAFRQLMAADASGGPLPALRRVVFGGEALELASLRPWFERHGDRAPRLTNMYGITETTVHVTERRLAPADGDGVRGSLVGRPLADLRVDLVDRCLRGVPLGVAGEVLVGGPGVARGYLGRPARTAERFVPDPFGDHPGQRLYRSGDLARRLVNGELAYLGRIDHQVKLRGFRIEPGEVETVLGRHPGVREAVVRVREDDAGKRRLVAYLVPAGDGVPRLGELRRFLERQLPAQMIPAIFSVLEELPLTAHGKVDLRALPDPVPARLDADAPFDAPRTPAEETLARIWAQVLRRERVGRDENFFELGGDSILGLQIVHRAAQAGLRLMPRQVFEHQTLARLAAAAGTATAAESEQGPVSGQVPLTPVQHWFFEHRRRDPRHFNQALLLVPGFADSEETADVVTLAAAVRRLVWHHDALRLRFVATADGWRQFVAGADEAVEALLHVDLSALAAARWQAALTAAAGQVQASLDLARGPVLRTVLFSGPAGRERLLLVAHHLVVDAVSWRILVEDLGTAYRRLRRGDAAELPAKTTSYKAWAERLEEYARSEALSQELERWTRESLGRAVPLPQDGPGGDNVEASSRSVSATLTREETRALLREVPAVYRTRIDDVLLSALAQGFAAWTGDARLLVDLEGHGREALFDDVDLSRTVGWFTTIFPVLLELGAAGAPTDPDPATALKRVKEQLRAVPGRGLAYGLLRYLGTGTARSTSTEPPPAEVSFNYLGQLDPAALPTGPSENAAAVAPPRLTLAAEDVGPVISPRERRRHLLEVRGSVVGERLRLAVTYSRNRHRRETVENLLRGVMSALSRLIAHCLSPGAGGATPSDFPLAGLSQHRLDRLLGAARGIEDLYPLSPLQEGILFHAVDAPASGVYVTQVACVLEGDFDPGALRRAWQSLVERHAILRTSYLWQDLERPLQVVRERVTAALVEEDWRGCPARDRQERLAAFLQTDRQRGFALSAAPLTRLAVLQLAEDTYQLVWSHHHLLLDGWSQQLLFRELFGLYDGLARGRELAPAMARPYRDYIAWLERRDLARAERYWRRRLAGFARPTVLGLPTRSASATGAGARQRRSLPASTTAALGTLARRRHLTLNTLVQGAWALLLARYSGGGEVLFGITVAGRPAELPGVESMCGLFVNTLPARVQVPGARPLATWLAETQAEQAEMRQYEHSPLARVQSWSEVPQGTPLFDTILAFENYPIDVSLQEHVRHARNGFRVRHVRAHEQTHYALTVMASPGEELPLDILYDGGRFDRSTVRRMSAHLAELLAGIVEDPERSLAAMPLLPAAERHQLLVEYNDTRGEPAARSTHELFEAQVESVGEAVAVVFGEEQLSYAGLDRRANRLARFLRGLGVGTEDRVGLCLERSPGLVVAMLGALKAGGAYVPFDPVYPPERLELMVDDSRVSVVLTQERWRAVLPGHSTRLVGLDRHGEAIRGESPRNLVRDGAASRPGPDHLAYVMYTSGSTGRPKGVGVVHRGLVRLVREAAYASISSKEVFLQLAPSSFDASTLEIWGPLTNGGRLVIFPAGPLSLSRLAAVVERHRVSTLWLTAGLFRQFVEDRPAGVEPLRQLLAGGDVLSVPHVEKVLEQWAGVRLINGYGPTENTTFTCCHPLAAAGEMGSSVPIGRPISDTTVYLLDRRGRPVPVGVAGQLWTGGEGLMRGYLGRPRRTAESLVPDSLSGGAGSRLYGTGDLARRLAGGEIEFLGRFDHQVKVRGHRVELGEVETMLVRHPAVKEAVVVAAKDAAGGEHLVGYVVTADGESAAELGEFLGRRLPPYMVPSAFVALPSLPLTAHGKVDRRALPAPGARGAAGRQLVAPRNEAERCLAAIWAEVLRLDAVGVHDNFFELGGDSILSLQIMSRASQAGLQLSPGQVFEHPTIAELAALATAAGDEADAAAGQGPVVGPVPLTPIQHWFFALDLPRPHHFNLAVLFEVREAVEPAFLAAAVKRLLAHHDALRLRFRRRNASWQQTNEDLATGIEGAAPFSQIELASLPPARRRPALEAAAHALQASFDLAAGPLLRVALFDLGSAGASRLLIAVHHLVADGVSWRILLEDLETVYRQLAGGREVELPPKTTSFRRWAECLAEHARSPELATAELGHWLASGRRGEVAEARLPVDEPAAANHWGSAREVSVSLAAEETRALLQEVPPVYRTEINDVLLAALALSLARFTGRERVRVDLEGHGREELFEGMDLSRTVGWFTTLFPVVLEVDAGSDPGVALKSVKEQLRRIPRRGIGYGLLRYLSGEREARELRALPPAEVGFNYLGQLDPTLAAGALFAPARESSGSACAAHGRRPHLLEVNARVAGGELRVSWGYSAHLHRRSTVEGLARRFMEELEALIAHCRSPEAGGHTTSDFAAFDWSQGEIDDLSAAIDEWIEEV